jgi:hypothetical protein
MLSRDGVIVNISGDVSSDSEADLYVIIRHLQIFKIRLESQAPRSR